MLKYNWNHRKHIIKKGVKAICSVLTKIFGGNSDIAGWFVVYFYIILHILMYKFYFTS